MKTEVDILIQAYQKKSEKCRDKAQSYRDRDDIYASYVASAETYDLVIQDLKTLSNHYENLSNNKP